QSHGRVPHHLQRSHSSSQRHHGRGHRREQHCDLADDCHRGDNPRGGSRRAGSRAGDRRSQHSIGNDHHFGQRDRGHTHHVERGHWHLQCPAGVPHHYRCIHNSAVNPSDPCGERLLWCFCRPYTGRNHFAWHRYCREQRGERYTPANRARDRATDFRHLYPCGNDGYRNRRRRGVRDKPGRRNSDHIERGHGLQLYYREHSHWHSNVSQPDHWGYHGCSAPDRHHDTELYLKQRGDPEDSYDGDRHRGKESLDDLGPSSRGRDDGAADIDHADGGHYGCPAL